MGLLNRKLYFTFKRSVHDIGYGTCAATREVGPDSAVPQRSRRHAHPEQEMRTYDTYAGCSAYRLVRLALVAERHSVKLLASVLE